VGFSILHGHLWKSYVLHAWSTINKRCLQCVHVNVVYVYIGKLITSNCIFVIVELVIGSKLIFFCGTYS